MSGSHFRKIRLSPNNIVTITHPDRFRPAALSGRGAVDRDDHERKVGESACWLSSSCHGDQVWLRRAGRDVLNKLATIFPVRNLLPKTPLALTNEIQVFHRKGRLKMEEDDMRLYPCLPF